MHHHQRTGQRIAPCFRHERGAHGEFVIGVGAVDGMQPHEHVDKAGEGGFRVLANADNPDAFLLEQLTELVDLIGFATFGNGDDHVVRLDRAHAAMQRIHGMQIYRRRAGYAEQMREPVRDGSGGTGSGDEHLAFGPLDHRDRLKHGVVNLIGHFEHGPPLHVHGCAGDVEQSVPVDDVM